MSLNEFDRHTQFGADKDDFDTTYYIVPAWSDQASQCRIVARAGRHENPGKDYSNHPECWKDVGLMNSRGKLVCLDAPAATVQEFRDCEPMMAGMTIYVKPGKAQEPTQNLGRKGWYVTRTRDNAFFRMSAKILNDAVCNENNGHAKTQAWMNQRKLNEAIKSSKLHLM